MGNNWWIRAGALLPLGLLLLSACGADAAQTGVRMLAAGAQSSVGEPRQEVIRDRAALHRLMQQVRQPVPPQVDFERELVVAVFMGTRPTSGYRIEVVEARREGNDLVVGVRTHSPPPGAILLQVITTPYQIVAVPRVPGRVRFVETGEDPGERRAVRMRELARGHQSGIRERELVVVRTSLEWRELWRRHTAGQRPAPALPEVDFERQMVLAAFMGQQRTGGFSIEIAAVQATPREVLATVRERRPGPDDIVTQALTQPFHFVVIERPEVPVRFRTEAPPTEVQPRELDSGQQSGVRERTLTVIRTPREWRRFWERHTQPLEPRPPLPRVDFEREMVVVALLGEQRTSGYDIRVASVAYGEDEVVVRVRETRPAPGAFTLPMLTQPHQIVTVQRSEADVRFEVER